MQTRGGRRMTGSRHEDGSCAMREQATKIEVATFTDAAKTAALGALMLSRRQAPASWQTAARVQRRGYARPRRPAPSPSGVGFVGGFLLLDERDDRILDAIRVSPVPLNSLLA